MSKYLLGIYLTVTFACMALAAGSVEAYASTDMALEPSAESEKNQVQQASGDDIQLAAVSGDALGAQGGSIVPDGGGTSGVTPAALGTSEQLYEPLSDSLNQGDESTVVASAPPVTASMLEKNIDNDGDGRTELVTFYNYDNANTTLWQFDSADTGFAAPQAVWNSGAGNWDWSRSKVVGTDYNGNGRTELAVFYDYGSDNTGLWLFDPTDTGFSSPRLAWSSGAGNWDWSRSKPASTDYDGDGRTELAVFYDYGSDNTGLWLFDPTDTGFSAPRQAWSSGAGNWDWVRSKVISVDYNGNGRTELAVFYDYGAANTGLWLFDPSDTGFAAPRITWSSGTGNWDWGRSKLACADYNGNGRTELAVFYDYGSDNTGLWLFDPTDTGFDAPSLAWGSGAGNWEWSRSRVTRTDYNGDGKTELAIIYNYGGANTALWLFDPTDTGFDAPSLAWSSGAGNWEWLRSKINNGEHFKPKTSLISVTLLEVNLSTQSLIVHGNMVIELEEHFFTQTAGPFTSFLICSGKPGWETPTGLYRIHSKQLAVDMSSGPGWSEQYYVPGVPYVFWFIDTMYAVHGAYWLGDSEFGTPRSHGCINVPVSVGAWLYGWVPTGTLLLIHY